MSNHIYAQDFLKQLRDKYFGNNDRYTAVIYDGVGFTFALEVYEWDFDTDDWLVRMNWTKDQEPTLEVRYLDEIASTNNRHSAIIDNHIFELLKLLDQARNDIRAMVEKTEVYFV